MPAAFDDAHFAFFGTVVTGQPQQRERWKRALDALNGYLGGGPLSQAVGQLYVREYFSPQAKAAVAKLVDNLLAAYRKRIETSPWMSPETRRAAMRKAETVQIKIGYPDRWTDYSALTIEPDDAAGNERRLNVFEWNRLVARLNDKTDRQEWGMGAQYVNAYYNPVFNEIVFPAAILQPPLFDPKADLAVNYGGVGGVIGHEMGHGYDDQGAKSDEHGVLRSWWQPEDEARFKVLTQALAAQFSAYSPLPGLHINGEFTSGENMGDLGGLSVAHEAYRIALDGHAAPVIDGFTGDQRFFLGWAQVWRGIQREESLRYQVTSDVHSPDPYRVNGIVRNIDAWYEAFGVKAGDAMYLEPAKRVHIW
jgi:predicted metalloendopeptidase